MKRDFYDSLYDSYFRETEDEYNNITRSNIEDYIDYSDVIWFCHENSIETEKLYDSDLDVDEILNKYWQDILYFYKDRILDDIESRKRLEDSY